MQNTFRQTCLGDRKNTMPIYTLNTLEITRISVSPSHDNIFKIKTHFYPYEKRFAGAGGSCAHRLLEQAQTVLHQEAKLPNVHTSLPCPVLTHQ